MTRIATRRCIATLMLSGWAGVAFAQGPTQGQTKGQTTTRTYSVGSFERVRVEGAFDVRLTTAASPRASATGPTRAVDALIIEIQGGTLTVRARTAASGETPPPGAAKMIVTLATPLLRSGNVSGGGRLRIAPMKAERIDLAVSGTGELFVEGASTDQLNATLVGPGAIHLAGRAQRAMLQLQGAGSVDAAGLMVNDLSIRSDGTGETHAAARFTARISAVGLGAVTVDGKPACTVRAPGGAPVSCGVPTAGR